MRAFRHRNDSGIEVALANFSLTFAKALLVFCVVLFLLISPKQGVDGAKPKAEYLITIDWSVNGKYDVDLWTRLPDGSVINYMNRESGVVFLQRDDLGQTCDLTTTGGKRVNDCEEIVVIRGLVPGEYESAIHLYSANGSSSPGAVEPVEVHYKIEKLNPDTDIVWQTVTILNAVRQEKPIVRFTVNSDGSISDIETDDLPSIVYSRVGREQQPGGNDMGPSNHGLFQ